MQEICSRLQKISAAVETDLKYEEERDREKHRERQRVLSPFCRGAAKPFSEIAPASSYLSSYSEVQFERDILEGSTDPRKGIPGITCLLPVEENIYVGMTSGDVAVFDSLGTQLTIKVRKTDRDRKRERDRDRGRQQREGGGRDRETERQRGRETREKHKDAVCEERKYKENHREIE